MAEAKERVRRQSSSGHKNLKEKVVQIYQTLFETDDPARNNANFWDELFLLRVNGAALEKEVSQACTADVHKFKPRIGECFHRCVEALSEHHPLRVCNAMHTVCALARGVVASGRGTQSGFDVIDVLIGFDVAEQRMQVLLERVAELLRGEYPRSLKSVALKLLLVLATLCENVSQNTLLEYLMMNSLFDALSQILSNAVWRQHHGTDALLLLTLLVQYNKHETANPYTMNLSILDDELALNGLAQVIAEKLKEFNRGFNKKHPDPPSGFFATLTNMVGNMFAPDESPHKPLQGNDAILLALYEAVHLNRHFMTTLAQPQAPVTPPVTPPTTPTSPDTPKGVVSEHGDQPTNLLGTLLEYISIVSQDTRELEKQPSTRLCFIILSCIAEDQYAGSLMHDMNMNFRVPIHRMPMRHRKGTVDTAPTSRPLATSLIDLMVEYLNSHLVKKMPLELYSRCLGVLHRLLCYQKRSRVRLDYPWKNLWTALVNVLKFILGHESQLLKEGTAMFHICSKVVCLFNLFVTYGDTFLPNPAAYDELYYEVIRVHSVFDNLYSMALRYSSREDRWKESAVRLCSHLTNVRAIISHFAPKVDSWAAANKLSSLTEDQVLEVVRSNYETLTLRLQESLDQFERYTETTRDGPFFTNLVRGIVHHAQASSSYDVMLRQSSSHDLETM